MGLGRRADVIPSLGRWMPRDVVGQKLAASVAGMDAIDPDSFEIKLSRPYPAMLFSLGSGIGQVPVVMRAQDLAGDPAKPVTTAIGSGPFRFNQDLQVSGALAVFDRNPGYVPRDGLAGCSPTAARRTKAAGTCSPRAPAGRRCTRR